MNKEGTVTTVQTVILESRLDTVSNRHTEEWKILENTPIEGTPTLELIKSLKDGESSITGDVLIERSRTLGKSAGQQHLEQLLVQHKIIPEEWQLFYLVAPGTRRLLFKNDIRIPYLRHHYDRWYLDWRCTKDTWDSNARIVQCK